MSYIKKYQFWMQQQNLDPMLLNELMQLKEHDIEEVFHSDLSFGTGGMRGLMGVGTNRVNVYTIRKATLGFARYIKRTKLEGGVAISYDNRHHSKQFAKEAAMVLAAEGIPSYLFAELRPTPMLSFAVRHFHCAGGIMITASHNPKEYNGYKVYDPTGAQVNLSTAEHIIRFIDTIDNPFEIDILDNHLIHTIDQGFDDLYLHQVKNIALNPKTPKIKIVYSPLHGTGGTVIPKLLKNVGYELYPYEPQMSIDPNFSHTKSSNPEEKDAYIETIRYAKTLDADLILVTDPDADRLGVAVKHQGEYQLLSGNQTAAIELYYILAEMRKQGKLHPQGMIYKTIVTTDLIDQIAKAFGVNVTSTLTGFKFIGEKAELNEKKHPYVFGCEESYGSLIRDFVRDKDAVQAVFMLAEIANNLSYYKKTLVDYLENMYQIYGYFYEYTKSLTLPGLEGLQKISIIMNHFRLNPPIIEGKALLKYDDLSKGYTYQNGKVFKVDLPLSDVLKYYYEDQTWIVFRPSGTEPKIKIYFQTVGQTMEDAKATIDRLVAKLSETISRL